MARSKIQTLPTINWTANNSALIWQLLTELAKKENHVALYGVKTGEKTIGSTKTKVFKGIASVLFPDLYNGNEDVLGARVKGKVEDLSQRYKKELKRITVTGGGLGGNDQDPAQSQSQDETLPCYIGADGPDVTTTAEARNIWEKINESFPFFGEMHRHLCGRPNTIPPVVTTGVGPSGRHVVQYQPIEERPGTQTATQASTVLSPIQAEHQVAIPTPTTPVQLQAPPSVPDGKENAGPPASASSGSKKRGPRDSSFTITEDKIETAKTSIKRVSKKSFEDRLADATEANLKAANERAAATLRLDKKRFMLEQRAQITKERDQIIEMRRNKLYSEDQTKRRLRKLDAREDELDRPTKRVRVRSPSPVSSVQILSSPFRSSPLRDSTPDWDIANGKSLPSDDASL